MVLVWLFGYWLRLCWQICRRLLLTPGPADKPMCCKIVRCPGGLLKGKSQYTLMAEEGGLAGTFMAAAFKHKSGPAGTTFLLSVRGTLQHWPLLARRALSAGSQLCVLQKATDSASCAVPRHRTQVDQHDMLHYRTAGRIAKLRSNCLGTEFVLTGDASPSGSARCELAAALYQANVCGTKGPRKLTVVIPKLEPAGLGPLQLATKGDHALLSRWEANCSAGMCCVEHIHSQPARAHAHAPRAHLCRQVHITRSVVLHGAAQQAAPLEPVPGRLLPQLWWTRDARVCEELSAGVGGRHGGCCTSACSEPVVGATLCSL